MNAKLTLRVLACLFVFFTLIFSMLRYFLDNLPFGWMYRAASALLCFHMVVGFLILGNVLSRILHIKLSPRRVNDLGWRGKLEWLGCTAFVIVVSFVIANTIPFFDELTSLIGMHGSPPLLLYFKMAPTK